jgi:hypothetical protein
VSCPACGEPTEAPPLPEVVPERPPHARSARRRPGAPLALVLLCSGFAALGAAIGLFAAGHWPLGLVVLGVAALLLAALGGVVRNRPQALDEVGEAETRAERAPAPREE